MKLLLVSHPPLVSESGAAQVALSLAAALRDRGHDVTAWSPEPLAGARWWDRWVRQRRAIERFAAEAGPFDAIDVPAMSIGPRLARAAGTRRIVARSTQPEILYLADDLRAQLRRPGLRTPRHAVYAGIAAAAIFRGWSRAPLLLCQGILERDWMRRRFPRWASRLRLFVIAPPPDERKALATVRSRRISERSQSRSGTRFLWIGRWTPHKGTSRLVRFLRERAASHPDDRFTIAGCGTGASRDVPAELLRDGRLRLVPAFGRAELPDLLAEHDAGLFTSTVEGWGLSLNEMLEAGLTVYATPAGGVVDLEPYWGDRLRPFPPPDQLAPPGPEPDLEPYFERFSWPAIACRYEEDVLAPEARL